MDDDITNDEVDSADWTVLLDDRVDAIANQAANKLAVTFAGVTTSDDQLQEASIWLAVNAEQVRTYLQDPLFGERNLYRRLHDRLANGLRDDAAYSNTTLPLSAAGEE